MSRPDSSSESWDEKISPEIWQMQTGRWAAPQHYMCSYLAMFPPELPHYFIQRFTVVGDHVLDPFSGRGTTAVDAAASSRHGIGNDLNPLAVALTRGKLSNPSLEEVINRLNQLEENFDSGKIDISTLEKENQKIMLIFHPNTMKQLVYLKDELDWKNPGVDAFIVAALMGAMHGSSKGFLSLPMPNTFSFGWGYIQKKVAENPVKFATPDRDVFEVLRERVKRQLSKGKLTGTGIAIEGDVRNISEKIESNSVQLLFTSPPYLKVIKYGLYNWIRLWFLVPSGDYLEVDEKLDDTHALNDYLDFMKTSLEETLPLIDNTRGLSCWVIGDVKGINLALEVWNKVGKDVTAVDKDGNEIRYKLLDIVEDKIPDNEKVSKIWKTKTYRVQETQSNEVIREIGEYSDLIDAKKAKEMNLDFPWTKFKRHTRSSFIHTHKIEVKEKEIQIIESTTNDKSGKATPIDRILIIAPETSHPKSFISDSEIDWSPIQ